MGLIGVLIAVVVFIIFFSYLSNSPSLNPERSEKIQTEAQEVMDSTAEKAKLQQDRIKNIDLP